MKIIMNLYKNKDRNFNMIVGKCKIDNVEPTIMSRSISNDFIREQKHVENIVECEINNIIHSLIKELVQKYNIKPENFFSEDKENEE